MSPTKFKDQQRQADYDAGYNDGLLRAARRASAKAGRLAAGDLARTPEGVAREFRKLAAALRQEAGEL